MERETVDRGDAFEFGKPSLSRRIPRDVGGRAVRASPQVLQLFCFLELDRPSRGIHSLTVHH